MDDKPIDTVPLGCAWEYFGGRDYGPTWPSITGVIENLFRTGWLPATGRRPNAIERELIRFPADYEIAWAGGKSLSPGVYAEAYAKRPVDFCKPWRPIYDKDLFEDLRVSRADWDKLLSHLTDLGLIAPVQSTISLPKSARRTRVGEPALRRWYLNEYVPECKSSGRQPSAVADVAAAKVKFGETKVTRKQILALRAFAPDNWKKQGRRKGAKNSAERIPP